MDAKEIVKQARAAELSTGLESSLEILTSAASQMGYHRAIALHTARIQNKLRRYSDSAASYQKILDRNRQDYDALAGFMRVMINQGRAEEGLARLGETGIAGPVGVKLVMVSALAMIMIAREGHGESAETLLTALQPRLAKPDRIQLRLLTAAWRYEFDGNFSEDFELAVSFASEVYPEVLTKILRNFWDYFGPSVEVVQKYRMAAAVPACRDSEAFRSDYIGVLMEAELAATDIIREIGPAEIRSLAEAKLSATAEPEATSHVANLAGIFDYLLGSESIIRRHFRESKSISVVGNSPCEIGKNHGDEIDSSEMVVRFNRFAIDSRFQKDYGTKVDVTVRTTENDEIMERNSNLAKFVLIADPNLLFRPFDLGIVERLSEKGAPFACVPSAVYRKLTCILKARPSTGLVVLDMLSEMIANRQQMRLFGFAFLDQVGPGRTSAHYFEPAIPTPGHDWVKEREYCIKLFGPVLGS